MEENIITIWAKQHDLEVKVYYNEAIPYSHIPSYGTTYWGFVMESVSVCKLMDLKTITKASDIQIISDKDGLNILVIIKGRL